MTEVSATLVVKTQATIPGIPVCGIATYAWQEAEPMAILMTVSLPLGEPITWHFTRDMLDQAFSKPGKFAGEGDVMVKAETGRLHYWLASHNGVRRSIYTALEPVLEFIRQTFIVCPAELEVADVDDAIAQIFGSVS